MKRTKIFIAVLIIVMFCLLQSQSVLSNSGTETTEEPILSDNLDGNWTAMWELDNPANFTQANIDILNGKATLKLNKFDFIDESVFEFFNGSWSEYIIPYGNQGIGLDLSKDMYTLISDRSNNRVLQIDYKKWLWQYGSNTSSGYGLNRLVKPTFAIPSGLNKTLITDTGNNRVIEVGRNTEFYWQCGLNGTAGMGDNLLNGPHSAMVTGSNNVLIADTYNDYVVEFNRQKQRVWQYGYTDISNPQNSKLRNPVFAHEINSGNILITDRGNHRVVEIDRTGSIKWQYGNGFPGTGFNRLDTPNFAHRMDNGRTLISDTNNHRIIEVNSTGTIDWQYGVTKISGCGWNKLKYPTCAIKLENGNVLITDSGNHRVIEASRSKDIIWQYGTNETNGYTINYLDTPVRSIPIMKDILVGFYVSKVFDGGDKTNWTEISWESIIPQRTGIVFYTRTGNTPNPESGLWSDWSSQYWDSSGEPIKSPNDRYIQYCAAFITTDLDASPILKKVKVNGTRFEGLGELLTEFFEPEGLIKWQRFTWNGHTNGQSLKPYFQTSETSTWKKVAIDGDLTGADTSTGKIRFKFIYITTDSSISPVLFNFKAVYECLGSLDSIIISPDSMEVLAGEIVIFTSTGFDSYGRELSINPTWTSTVGEVSEGILIAQTVVGSGFVNASENGVTGSVPVTILPGPLDYIILKPEVLTLLAGESTTFEAFGFDKFGNTVEIDPEWGTDVGLMEENLFTAQNFAGRGTVKAMVGDIAGYANITIELDSTRHHPPEIIGRVPDQIQPEDSEPWILNLMSYERDDEDTGEKLLWYISNVNEDLLTVTGSHSKEDTLTFIPKPNAFGTNKATLWLVDSDNMTANQPLWINVTPVNDKPLISEVPDIFVHYDEPYIFDYSNYIQDIESLDEELTLSVKEPQDQKFTSVNGLNVTYNYPDRMLGQSIIVTLSVSDGQATVEEDLKVSITDNHAPILIKKFPELKIYEGESLEYIFKLNEYFSDPDGDKLSYFFTAQFLVINLFENNSVTISSPTTWSGEETITFRAIDPQGAMAEGHVKVWVKEVNNAPIILPIPDIYLHYDYDYRFNLSKYVQDPDNDTSELQIWTSDTGNISIPSSESMIMILNYPESLLGRTIWVKLFVSDGIAISTGEFWVHVTNNFPPILKQELLDVYFKEDTSLDDAIDLTEYFFDMDDAQLIYSFDLQDPENITITISSNNTVSFKSKKDWFGNSYALFRAQDKTSAFVESGINIVIIPVNDAPIILEIPEQKGKTGERWVLDLTPYLGDVDNDLSELELSVAPEHSELVTITGKQLTFHADKPVNIDLEIFVNDGIQNNTGTVKLTISKPAADESMIFWVWLLLVIIILIVIITILAIYKRKRGSYIITDVFLMHNNGILIKYLGDTLDNGNDEDIISGMLTAVQAFISDSFATESNKSKEEWKLNQLRMGGHEIMFEKGKYVLLTVIYEGEPGLRLKKILTETVSKIEDEYGKSLDKWNGRFDLLDGVEEIIKPLMTKKKMIMKFSKKESKSSDETEITAKGISQAQLSIKQTTYQSKLLPKSTQQHLNIPTQEYIRNPQLPPYIPNVRTTQPITSKMPEYRNRSVQNLNQNSQVNQTQQTFDVHLPGDKTKVKSGSTQKLNYVPGTVPGQVPGTVPKRTQK